jgi:hypothetical protein
MSDKRNSSSYSRKTNKEEQMETRDRYVIFTFIYFIGLFIAFITALGILIDVIFLIFGSSIDVIWVNYRIEYIGITIASGILDLIFNVLFLIFVILMLKYIKRRRLYYFNLRK